PPVPLEAPLRRELLPDRQRRRRHGAVLLRVPADRRARARHRVARREAAPRPLAHGFGASIGCLSLSAPPESLSFMRPSWNAASAAFARFVCSSDAFLSSSLVNFSFIPLRQSRYSSLTLSAHALSVHAHILSLRPSISETAWSNLFLPQPVSARTRPAT